MSASRTRLALMAIFFLSGAVAIVYEVLWLRVFTHVVGTGIQSVSAVVTAFMLGLALGGALLGRRADRTSAPLRLYALLEVSIGVIHLVAFALFSRFDLLYAALFAVMPYPVLKWVVFLVAAVFVTVPASLIGGTVPVLLKHFAQLGPDPDQSASKLYAINTFGAVVGAMALAHAFLPAFGYQGTLLAACGSSLVLGLVALAIGGAASPSPEPAAPPAAGGVPIPAALVLGAYAASGFAALGYEVVWSRLFEFVLNGQLQSFAYLLLLYLSGIVAGTFLGARVGRSGADPRTAFGAFSWAAGVATCLSLVALSRWGLILPLFATIFGITVIIGATFPLALRLRYESVAVFGRTVGDVYSANTLGSILGSALAGFLLVPRLGSQGTLLLLAAIHVIAGVAVLRRARPRAGMLALALGAGTLAVVGLGLPGDALRKAGYKHIPKEVIFSTESEFEILAVLESPLGSRTLYGSPQISGTTERRSVQLIQGHLAMLLHPHPERVLEVGYGVGEILRSIERHEPKHVDLVELDGAMIPVANEYFEKLNEKSSDAKGVRQTVMDGRHFLAMTREEYDVIMSDTFFIASEGSSRLYTLEHFENGLRHLAPDGLMIIWIPLNMGDRRSSIVLNTFRHVFPHVLGWRTGADMFVVGARAPLALSLGDFRRRFDERSREDLKRLALDDHRALLGGFVFATEDLDRCFPRDVAPLHHDLAPTLDFAPVNDFDPAASLHRMIEAGSPRALRPWLARSTPEELAEFEATARAFAEAHPLYLEARRSVTRADRPYWSLDLSSPPIAELEASVGKLEEALVRCPVHQAARLLHGEVCRALGQRLEKDAKASLSWHERSVSRLPLGGAENYWLGRAYEKAGDKRVAEAFERVKLTEPYFRGP